MDDRAKIDILDRMVMAVETVRNRLARATSALEAAGVAYAVAGGNAVAAWVATVDEAAVRNTQDVDLLLRRRDMDAAEAALAGVGFVRRHVAGVDVLLDGPGSKPRDAVRVIFAGEKVREDDAEPAPDVSDSETITSFRVVGLASLVRMTLTSFRDKDRVHLRDLVDVGLIDESWPDVVPAALRGRLRHILDTPDG